MTGKPAAALYEEFVRSTAGVRLDGMKIVIDCANGAASALAKNVFSRSRRGCDGHLQRSGRD